MDIGGYADQVYGTLIFGENIMVVVGLLCISHDRYLQRGVVVADNAADIVLATVFPGTVLVGGKDFLVGLVAYLHIVNAGGDAGFVNGFDQPIFKHVAID